MDFRLLRTHVLHCLALNFVFGLFFRSSSLRLSSAAVERQQQKCQENINKIQSQATTKIFFCWLWSLPLLSGSCRVVSQVSWVLTICLWINAMAKDADGGRKYTQQKFSAIFSTLPLSETGRTRREDALWLSKQTVAEARRNWRRNRIRFDISLSVSFAWI